MTSEIMDAAPNHEIDISPSPPIKINRYKSKTLSKNTLEKPSPKEDVLLSFCKYMALGIN